MASSTKESAVSESKAEPQGRPEDLAEAAKSVFEHFREYGREQPEILALWCFGIGFVLGWKLKPW
jgi:hypothetical protein